MLGHLKDIFLTIPMYLLSAMVTPNIMEYIWAELKFSLPLQIYRQPFDYLNLTYIVSPIRKTRFKNLDFFISSESAVSKILKTIVFVDKIDDAIQMAKYL